MSEIQFNVEHPNAGPVVALLYLPNDRFAYVIPALMDQAQLCIGDKWTCEHRYTYPSVQEAIFAFLIWNPEADEEPMGWHRHQPSNRRRTDGDPEKEYVRA